MPGGGAEASGAASVAAAPEVPRATRCPIRKATSAITAMPGTIHGSVDLALGPVDGLTDAPQ